MVQISAARRQEPRDKVLEKKREILDAASRVFRLATGMRDIAEELGMAVGNLYYYFKDKEGLLALSKRKPWPAYWRSPRGCARPACGPTPLSSG